MSSNDIAISVRNLTKTYRLFGHPGDRIKQLLSMGLKQYHREFTALKDVSFDVKRGDAVGIMGRNGAGKSTLLQLTCGILKPTSGTVSVNGRLTALLELGGGFNPDFTGRENVFFYGALLGFDRRTMESRFDEIAAFADIGDFMDQPVRTYSSGMLVRLAFSVAIGVDPDILIVDEALAVGDARFQARSFRRMADLVEQGSTLLYVSHALEQLPRIVGRGMVVERGRVVYTGPIRVAVYKYVESLSPVSEPLSVVANVSSSAASESSMDVGDEFRYGLGTGQIQTIELRQSGRANPGSFSSGESVQLRLVTRFHENVSRPVWGFSIKTKEGITLCGASSLRLGQSGHCDAAKAGEVVRCQFEFNPYLAAGDYLVSVSVMDNQGEELRVLDRRLDVFCMKIVGESRGIGLVDMKPVFSIPQLEAEEH